MALDTRNKRASALLAGLRGGLLPAADGAVDQADRQQLSAVYGGVLAQVLDADVRASIIGLGLPFGFPLPRPTGDAVSQRDRQQLTNNYRGISAETVSFADRRASMLGLGLPFGFPLPFPAGVAEAPSQFDRQQLANSYAGILAGAAAGGITDAILSGNEVVELADNGTVVGTVLPVGGGSPLSFALTNDAGGAFAIDAVTGVITVANGALLDFEASPADKSIMVQISDGGTPFAKSFTIVVLDAAGPSDIIMDNQSVEELSSDGTLVGTASGIGGIPPYGYGFAPGGNPSSLFAIGGATGAVTVAHGSPLDYESSPAHQIIIEVTDSEGKSFAKGFTISVIDVIEAAGGTPEDVEAAYAQVTADGATIIIPAGEYQWTRGVTIPASFPYDNLHIRGADWSPASTLYRTATNGTQIDQAFADFEPATRIFFSGDGASATAFTCDRSDVTFSRLWFRGRDDREDTAIRLTDMDGCVVYYCRFENHRDHAIVVTGPAGPCLVTDNVSWQRNVNEGGGNNTTLLCRVNFSTNPESLEYVYGNTDMLYFQRNLVRCGVHAFDLAGAGRGACRDNILVNGIGSGAMLRVHGAYIFSGAQQWSGGPWEFYRNKYFHIGGTNPFTGTTETRVWRLALIFGYNGIFHANEVVSGDFPTNPVVLGIEETIRQPADGNLQCSDPPLLTAGHFPRPNQTRSAFIWDNLNLGNPLVADSAMVNACHGRVIKIAPDSIEGESQVFNSAHPTWSDPGAHPLMPFEITA